MEEQTKEQLLARIRELEAQVRSLNNSIIDRKDEYGLRWIDVPEAFEAESENKIPILEEVKDLAIKNDDGKPTHILIEGDNYHALQCLNYTHKGKIDVIYIDPPYNTGKEFVYKDKRVLDKFPNGQTIDGNHPLRHSAWLSFMNKRLELAKNLLSERGVIFISIDDNEQANLKLLCDKVFDEKNFVGQYMWFKSATPPNLSHKIKKNIEYVLCYEKAKNTNVYKGRQKMSSSDDPFTKPQNSYKTLTFPPKSIICKTKDTHIKAGVYGTKKFPNELLNDLIVENGLNKNEVSFKNRFIWVQETLNKNITEGTTIKLSSQGVLSYKKANYSPEVPPNLIDDTVGVETTEQAGNLLDDMMVVDKIFEYPKSVSLLEYLLNFISLPTSVILDFFAGSGTTLHATMELNEKDGGNRQCIIVQMPELTWEMKDGEKVSKKGSENVYNAGYNTISEITYERNRRVIQGYTNAKGEQVAGLGNSLKYYKTAFVGNNTASSATDEDKVALAHKAGNLIAIAENTLEEIETTDSYQIFQNGNQYTAIYFTGNLEHFAEYAQKIEELRNSSRLVKVAAYIYCIGNVDVFESEFNKLARITLHAIPQPIIEIYKQLNA